MVRLLTHRAVDVVGVEIARRLGFDAVWMSRVLFASFFGAYVIFPQGLSFMPQ